MFTMPIHPAIGPILCAIHKMQYSEYYRKCRISYGEENSLPIEQFYADPVIRIHHEKFGEEYMDAVNKLSEGVKKDIDLQQSSSRIFNLLRKMTQSMSAFLSHTIC